MTPRARFGSVLLVVSTLVAGCDRSSRTADVGAPLVPMTTTDGRWSVVAAVSTSGPRSGCVQFKIRDAQGHMVHREQTGASQRMRWEFAWDDADRLWFYSGDIGTSYWERQDDGVWKREEPGVRKRNGDPVPPPPRRIRDHQRRVGLG